MKKIFLIPFLISFFFTFSQEKKTSNNESTYLQLDYLQANILPQEGINHLITGYPKGLIVSWNKRTFGEKLWQQYFNYPDFGFSFSYQDFQNKFLGELYGVYGHYNHYLLDRESKNKLMFSFGIGLAYSTNPYDKVTNNKNVALGTHINSTSYIKLFYQREHLIKNIGIQAGFAFIHASNASFKAPNKGVNTWGLNVGLNYDLKNKPQTFIKTLDTLNYRERIHFNAALFAGFNESDDINTGIKPFAVVSLFADKRLNRKHAIQFGTQFDFNYYLKEYIKFRYVFNGEVDRTSFPDWKRISVFIGHELFINKTAIFSEIGYYVYSPAILNETVFERIGVKHHFNNFYFVSISIKAHFINAESLEFGIGYRF